MQVKTSLHLHTKEDKKDGRAINYTIYDLIDRAVELGFGVLAITGHEGYICKPEHIEYGKSKGILVIPGIELKISGKHILALNCDASIESLRTLEDLVSYKKSHPEIFIIAPHPNHGVMVSLGLKKLKKFFKLFDAVEHSWYYSKRTNPNLKVARVCQDLALPFIATADMHDLDYLDRDYAILELDKLEISAVFAAISNRQFINVSQPKSLAEMCIYQIKMFWRGLKSYF